MTAQIDLVPSAPDDARGLFPPGLGPLDLTPLDLGVHDLTDAQLVVAARVLAAVDATMAQEDVAALEAAFAGDHEDTATGTDAGFRAFMTRYERRVRALLRRYLRRPQDVDEGVQDAFLRLWLCWDPGQTDGHRRALLFRITRHTACDILKSRAFREYEKTVFADVEDEAAVDAGPDDDVLRTERIEEVRAALAELPPQQRDLMIARWYEEVPFADLAASYGTTDRALITQQTRIFKKMRARLTHATLLPLARPWTQRFRSLLASMTEVNQNVMIGVIVTSLATALPGGVPIDPMIRRAAADIPMEWQRPVLPRGVELRAPTARDDGTSALLAEAVARATAPHHQAQPDAPPRPLPALPIPTPDVDVGPCGERPDGDAVTVEVTPLGVRQCRQQNIAEVCPVFPTTVPGASCQTQGKPSYLVPLPRPTAGVVP